MAVARRLESRLAALEEAHAPVAPPPELVDVVPDCDGIARVAFDDDGRRLSPAMCAALGLPRRVAPGAFRDASGQPREATLQERIDYYREAGQSARRAAGPEARPESEDVPPWELELLTGSAHEECAK